MLKKMEVSFAQWKLTFGQVLAWPLECPLIVKNRVNDVTDRLQIVYCLFIEIIHVLLLNALIRGVVISY